MVETLSVGRFLMWQISMNPLFLSPVTVLFTDETLTFSFRARLATCGLTRPVARSILLSKSRKICSGRSYGRLGGLPLGLPVALCFMGSCLIVIFFDESWHRCLTESLKAWTVAHDEVTRLHVDARLAHVGYLPQIFLKYGNTDSVQIL